MRKEITFCSKKRKTKKRRIIGAGGKFIDCDAHLLERGLCKSMFIVDANSHPCFQSSRIPSDISSWATGQLRTDHCKSVQNRQTNYSRCIGSILNENDVLCYVLSTSRTLHAISSTLSYKLRLHLGCNS